MSVVKSTPAVKTFTVREFNRPSVEVLATADREGLTIVRGRNNRAYDVRPRATEDKKPDRTSFAARRRQRRKELLPKGPIMTPAQAREFDRLLAEDARLLASPC